MSNYLCEERSIEGFVCTLKKNHQGDHKAYGHICLRKQWENIKNRKTMKNRKKLNEPEYY